MSVGGEIPSTIKNLIRIDGLPISILENLDGNSLLGMDVLGKLKMVQEGKRLTLSRR